MKISEDRFRELVAGTARELTVQERLIRQHASYAIRYRLDPVAVVEARMPSVSIVRRDPHAIRPRIERGPYITQGRRTPVSAGAGSLSASGSLEAAVGLRSSEPDGLPQQSGVSRLLVEFSNRHNIPIDLFFDAHGMSLAEYGPKMEAMGSIIAYNVSPCAKAGHSTRNRYGKCVACDPRQLGFNQRAVKSGFVYAAFSMSKKLVKIGFATDVGSRHKALVSRGYAGASDWQIFYQKESERAARLEIDAQKAFAKSAVRGLTYFWDGKMQNAREVFSCTQSEVIDVLERLSEVSECHRPTIKVRRSAVMRSD
jgi:T5orf172 domain